MNKKPFTLLSIPTARNTLQIMDKFLFPIDLTKGKYTDIKIISHNSEVSILHENTDLRDFSFIWLSSGWNYRDIAYAIHLYLKSTETPHSFVEKNSSKVTDYLRFGLNKLPIPDSVFIGRKHIEKNMDLIKKVCGFPLIIKDIRGCQGKHSAYINSPEELLAKMPTLPKNKRFIFQRFIPNLYDWGIMVANGEVVSGEKSYPPEGEFRNNTCNGAAECFTPINDIPQNIKDIAIAANNLLGLSWSRADIIIDKNTGKPYVLEVNRFPGITACSDEVTGAYKFLSETIAKPKL